jgi:hypothetical protein
MIARGGLFATVSQRAGCDRRLPEIFSGFQEFRYFDFTELGI